MSDIKTSVVITADASGLRSGLGAASAAVREAIEAMRAQFGGIGSAAQQAQGRVADACARIGAATTDLRAQVASLAGSAALISGLGADQRVADAGYARRKAAIASEGELGQASARQEVAQLQALLDDKWALDEDYLARKLAAAEGDVQARQKLLDEERLDYEKFLTEKQRLDTQAALASERAWQAIFEPIERAFDTSITGMILGTTNLQKAVATIGRSILAEFVSLGVRMLTQWVATELGMTAATEAGAAARTAAEGEGLLAGLALKAVNAVQNILSDAAQTFAGVFAFLAPLMGPAAAGPAAAASASVSAMTGAVASAAGGWVVPSDQLAMVHQNEMVLPAHLSQGLQQLIGNGAGPAPVVVNVSAIDAASFRNFVMSRSDVFAAALQKASRNFNPALAGARA